MALPPARVFISRPQTAESVFAQMLEAAGLEVFGQSLLTFRARVGWYCPPCDWIFFSSPRAVRFFFKHLSESDGQASARLAALGPGTAAAVEEAGRSCAFIGSGNPTHTADQFLRFAQGAHVVFPRALHSRRSIQRALADKIRATEIVVYENRPATDLPPGPFQVLVFTSPMNAEAWFAQRAVESGQRIIAIGRSTADALRRLGIEALQLAARPTEKALAEAVLRTG